MGAWGPGLYQDDTALDVRDYYKDQLHRGKEGKQITQELIHQNEDAIADQEDGPVFWLALADVQWKMGRLEEEVKQQALYIIENEIDLLNWRQESPGDVKRRERVLSELKEKLLSPQPEKKKVSQYRLYHCNWRIGDVYAYRFFGNESREKGFFGKYMFFVKTDEIGWHPGHRVPVVYFYWKLSDVLMEISQLEKIGYMPQFFTKKAYVNNPKLKKTYRLTLLSTSSRIIPERNLTYPGNTKETKRIDTEDPHPYAVEWKYFEGYMIENIMNWGTEKCDEV